VEVEVTSRFSIATGAKSGGGAVPAASNGNAPTAAQRALVLREIVEVRGDYFTAQLVLSMTRPGLHQVTSALRHEVSFNRPPHDDVAHLGFVIKYLCSVILVQ
jgi:hypothetical protein